MTEAVTEVVRALTSEEFCGKMIVVLAGYSDEMEDMLRQNPGLSSRFSEKLIFPHFTCADCWELLRELMRKEGYSWDGDCERILNDLMLGLIATPDWGNGRDISTLSRNIQMNIAKVSKQDDPIISELSVEHLRVPMEDMLLRNFQAGDFVRPRPPMDLPAFAETFAPPPPPTSVCASVSVVKEEEESCSNERDDGRDDGVSDELWASLEAAKRDYRAMVAAEDERLAQLEKEEEEARRRIAEEAEGSKLVEEGLRRLEEERKHRAVLERRKIQQMREQRAALQKKLTAMGVCPMGYSWIPMGSGYRCAGGSHYIQI